MQFSLSQVLSLWIVFRTLARFYVAATIASAGVTVGLVNYLCLNNTFALILVALVYFDHTVQHL